MENLRRIVFFWVGQNTDVPALLVRSIRTAFGDDMQIVQLSNRETPEIDGVTIYKRLKLSSRIMVARLEAYAALSIKEPTLFLDADMLVVKSFDLPPLAQNEVGVTTRSENDDAEINWRFPIEFPEFKGKYFSQEMPFIYSFVYTASEIIFVRQLTQLRKLPKRYQEWYGDQVTLKGELTSGKFAVRQLSADIYNRTVRSLIEFKEILAGHPEVCIAHFKGPLSKPEMHEAINLL